MLFNGYEYIFRGPRTQEKEFSERYLDQNATPTIDIPCGKCELCRVEQRYSKAVRIMLEAESWPEATYFITLTYNQENHTDPDLDHKDWAQFMKNFREEFCQAKHSLYPMKLRKGKVRTKSVTFKKIKQVMCGEYGDTFGRKHFHGIIFNHSFDDIEFTGNYSKKGNPIHTSKKLADVWKKGFVQLEKVNFDLALYVGSYVTDYMDETDVNTGHKKKQYGRFGKGIGETWIRKYWREVLAVGSIKTLEGNYRIPRYFVQKVKEWYPEKYHEWSEKKRLTMLKQRDENIQKGDGPLRRAKAEGKIFNHQRTKRIKDNGNNRSS